MPAIVMTCRARLLMVGHVKLGRDTEQTNEDSSFSSCHTEVWDGLYRIEGYLGSHIPANLL